MHPSRAPPAIPHLPVPGYDPCHPTTPWRQTRVPNARSRGLAALAALRTKPEPTASPIPSPKDVTRTWREVQSLVVSDALPDHSFGRAGATDGQTVVMSDCANDDSRGAVYVFEKEGDAWRETARLVAPDALPDDRREDAAPGACSRRSPRRSTRSLAARGSAG